MIGGWSSDKLMKKSESKCESLSFHLIYKSKEIYNFGEIFLLKPSEQGILMVSSLVINTNINFFLHKVEDLMKMAQQTFICLFDTFSSVGWLWQCLLVPH